MSEQREKASSTNSKHVPWWVQICRWLWKYPLPFLLGTLLINVVINIGSSMLIAPDTSQTIPAASTIGHIITWIGSNWQISLLLGTFSAIFLFTTWMGSHWPKLPPELGAQPRISQRDRDHLLRRLHLQYEQMLRQSLQGEAQVEL